MKKKVVFSMILVFVLIPLNLASENTQDEGVKANGIVLDIASDRKVETVGVMTQVEEISKYVQRKIDDADARISDLRDKVDRMEEQMNSLLEHLKNIPAPPNVKSSQKD